MTYSLALGGLLLLAVAFAILLLSPGHAGRGLIIGVVGLAVTGGALWRSWQSSHAAATPEDAQTDAAGSSAESLSRHQFDHVLRSLNEANFFVDPDGRIRDATAAAGQLLACDPAGLVGTDMQSLLTANDRRKISRQESWRPQEAVFRRADGEMVSVSYTKSDVYGEAGELIWQVYAVQNIHQRKQAENRIRYLARIDALTRMANRMQFQHLLQQAIARARRDGTYLAILYLDVDRFKDINDTFGHSAGDTSLEIFARRINSVLPDGAVPGRLAGDEFCVMLKSTGSIDAIVEAVNLTGEKLLESVGKPFRVQDEEIFMSTSIGAAIYPRDGENVVDLLRHADAALYQAKKAGGNCLEFYGEHVASASEERLMLKSKLRRAFEREELRLDYQPKYQLSDGRLAGVEALIRWDLPERGIVLPSDFIPIAEESNLILQLAGDTVARRQTAFGIEQDRKGQTQLLDERSDGFLSSLICAHCEHDEVTAAQAAVEALHGRHFHPARRAPGSP
jgi:diguanylate cyclase (GGDEF)-like protein/PAS domain S-box-containing protein